MVSLDAAASTAAVAAGVVAAGALAAVWYLSAPPDASDRDGYRRPKTTEAPWRASQNKGSNSYYYGHHTRASDGLAASDYQMNGPRRLDPVTKKPLPAGAAAAKLTAVNAERAPLATATADQGPARFERVRRYTWADTDDEVKIYVQPEGWDFATIAADDVSVTLDSPRSLTARIDYGGASHKLVLTNFQGPVTDLAWKKTKKRLVVTLKKRDTLLAWDKSWKELVSTKDRPSGQEDAEEAD